MQAAADDEVFYNVMFSQSKTRKDSSRFSFSFGSSSITNGMFNSSNTCLLALVALSFLAGNTQTSYEVLLSDIQLQA